MLLTEEQWIDLRASPLNKLVKKWTKAGEEMLAGEKTYYHCRPANYFRNIFSCCLYCPLDQESATCSEVPLDLRDCVPELIDTWNKLQGEKTMKKLVKKTITAKQSAPIVTKTVKPAIPQVSNGDFQSVIKGVVEAFDSRLGPVKTTLEGHSAALAKVVTATGDLSKGLSLLLKGLDDVRNTVVAIRKAIDNLPDSDDTKTQETEVTDTVARKKGRPPAGKMSISEALREIAVENDIDTDKGEMFDDAAFDDVFKLVCEKTSHIQQKPFVKEKAQNMGLLDK